MEQQDPRTELKSDRSTEILADGKQSQINETTILKEKRKGTEKNFLKIKVQLSSVYS